LQKSCLKSQKLSHKKRRNPVSFWTKSEKTGKFIRVRVPLQELPTATKGRWRHGLFARTLPFESYSEVRAYHRLKRELRRELGPYDYVQEIYLEQMASALWRFRPTQGRRRRPQSRSLRPRREGIVG